MKSGSGFHYIKMTNGKYPSNPSVQEKSKEDIIKELPAILDIYAQDKKHEKYSF